MTHTFPVLSGLRIGHAGDPALKSGATVLLPDVPAVAGVHVGGGAPGTRETDLLRPEATVERVDAIVLSGGSAFGLAAADGAMSWLAGQGRGFAVGPVRVPIVPAAILFDLANGGDKTAVAGGGPSRYRAFGTAACEAAATTTTLGTVGAGTGAFTADLKGGFGAASAALACGATVQAFVAANPLGRATLGSTPHFRAAPFEIDGEFGGLGLPSPMPADAGAAVTKLGARAGGNTTIAVIATDLALAPAQATRIAAAAHDGLALSIYPVHTPMDGDTVFVLSTGRVPLRDPARDLTELSAGAAAALARAVARAVYEAAPAPGDPAPTWRERYGLTA
ncbi:P1 family peptidase [Propylenella binzhouense]|uniref:Peptidase T4 n=1 Tax=Propylenella binzhouense TaxID=2555902 RepID=A0A964T4B7_9HYPH|nr:P1 family peptidase [Propylenella binzhouense]MYZ48084.1 peptidase T4 [Propylenella binzhouense]